ncbi:MBL fold metallo-hydrolase [Anatilimnocola floriformis]|uniref:MBL fold metallo-hydrolase n=1 Tax=Anatilimnocola floriformis TaxID=2948575 RepID=UPI0020C47F16|nr:MBL fold metallo-hydrolase [Anatilimnocola floriformis]
MQLLLLGTTGYHPSPRRHTACLLFPEIGLALDAGTGFFRVRDWLRTSELDVFLTHAHLDHVAGLTFLFDVAYETGLKTTRVHGDEVHLRGVQDHLFAPALFPVLPPLTFQPLNGPTEVGGDGLLTYFPLVHPGGSLGYRIDWPDRSFAYVTDTTARPDAPYIESIRGVDLLVHECNFGDGWEELAEKTGHSCLTPVLEVARAAQVKRLILTHVNPIADDADPMGLGLVSDPGLPVSIGFDLQQIEF